MLTWWLELFIPTGYEVILAKGAPCLQTSFKTYRQWKWALRQL